MNATEYFPICTLSLSYQDSYQNSYSRFEFQLKDTSIFDRHAHFGPDFCPERVLFEPRIKSAAGSDPGSGADSGGRRGLGTGTASQYLYAPRGGRQG